MESNSFFSTARPSRLFFTVAIPGMISMLAMSLYSVIEGAFIGKFLGETAFAAVNIAMPLVMMNFSLADLIGVGSSVPISIALGRGDRKSANNYFSCSLILIFAAAILMGIALFFGAPLFVGLMGAEGELASLAVKYVRVFALMGPITTLLFAMDNYLRICGFVKGSMALNIAMSVMTAVLIFVFIGVLDMNVDGSALATCISMSLCVLCALIPFLARKALLKFVRPKLELGMIKRIVACGAPVFLNNIAGRVAAIILNWALLIMGGQTAVAAYSVLMYAGSIIEPMMYGMCDSVQPAVGYNWGAGALDRVKKIAKCSFAACGILSLVGTAAMLLFPTQISTLFVDPADTALLEMSVRAMRIFALAFLFRWFGFAIQSFFAAIEKPMPATAISVASALVFPVAFVVLLWGMGLDGLWLNFGATSFSVAVMAFFMLLYVQKKMDTDIKRQLK